MLQLTSITLNPMLSILSLPKISNPPYLNLATIILPCDISRAHCSSFLSVEKRSFSSLCLSNPIVPWLCIFVNRIASHTEISTYLFLTCSHDRKPQNSSVFLRILASQTQMSINHPSYPHDKICRFQNMLNPNSSSSSISLTS